MKNADGYKNVRYVSIVGKNRAAVIDWYGNRVTKEMPLAFAKAYVQRHSSNLGS
jgi:hypothetical protein